MSYQSLEDIVNTAKAQKVPFWRVVIDEEIIEEAGTFEQAFERMRGMFLAMKEADQKYDGSLTSNSGLSGKDGQKLEDTRKGNNPIMGEFLSMVIEKAVKMAESNACMRRIVAAPTAGSCGVIPAVILTYIEKKTTEEDRVVEALFVAGGIGKVLAMNASIAGAEGGCQAEIGSAAAMAAGALTYLEGGDNEAILDAVAICIKSMLGLVCDPVAGLVEVPCVKRNAFGATNAVVASHMAIAGVHTKIPADEVIDAMRRVGHLIPCSLRETSEEGLATTATGVRLKTKEEHSV